MMPADRTENNDVSGHVERPAGFKIVYVDASVLVLDKPPGLLSVPGRGDDKQDCLSRRVQAVYPDALVVHRLDMSTSGLVLMARGIDAQRALGRQFERRTVSKRYAALVEGLISLGTGMGSDGWAVIDLPIAADWPNRPLRVIDVAGKSSQTRFRVQVCDAEAGVTRVELEPITGRSHQLRVHLQALGHPVVGDALYGTAEFSDAPRLMLHATRLEFDHPAGGQRIKLLSHPAF
jgi:tRNA pseudouridine32 synthase / 23S rRNA pseudouridine746 synthase